MELGIQGKYALVTGGTHGIGLETAIALAREGCNVAVCARDEGRLSEAAARIEEFGVEALAIQADVLKEGDIDRTVETMIDSWGTAHILVNNVGGGGRWGKEIVEETEDRVWLEVYEKNAMAAVRFTRLLIPYMRAQSWGRVVTVASRLGREGGGRPWFNMAKASEISLMKTLAMTPYLARDGITFNTVAPGSIMIPDTGWAQERDSDPARFEAMLDRDFPMNRLGTPEEVAAVIAFVCSQPASLMSGATILVDGGESASF